MKTLHLLVLLCYYADMNSYPIYFTPRQKKKDIPGCDSTSRIYGLEKGMALRIFKQNEEYRKSAAVFCRKDAIREDVVDTRKAALLCLFKELEGKALLGKFLKASSLLTQKCYHQHQML